MKGVAFADHRLAARRRLPRFLFDYIDGGSFDELTLARNRTALRAVALRQRVMRDMSVVDTRTSLFGEPLALPVILAPVGLAGLYARRGEAQAARAASAAGIPMCLSSVSICGVDEVAAASRRPLWFQLYMARDRGLAADLLAHARAAGCTVLLLTVDMARYGARYREHRSGLAGPAGLGRSLSRAMQIVARPGWAIDVGLAGRPHVFGNLAPLIGADARIDRFASLVDTASDPGLDWADIAWLRAHWEGPIVLKGMMDPEDALIACEHGAEGLVVSNHGGRQLDGVPGTAEILPRIADLVGDRTCLLVDGGVRNGVDILRMLALGARGVMLGRAWAFALAGGGGAAVHAMVKQLGQELCHAMALAGCASIAELGPHIIAGGARRGRPPAELRSV